MKIQTRCARIKLKPGQIERVREWAQTLNNSRRGEAIATLRDETVILENYYLDRRADGDYLIAFMMAENFDQARHAVEGSRHDIDRYHQAFKSEVWEKVQLLEPLIELDRINEITA